MIAKPRIEKCGNHWCVETFNEMQFFSRCYPTWDECLEIVRKWVSRSGGKFIEVEREAAP